MAVREHGALATSNTARVDSASGSPGARGHYFIDGYTIRLAFDGGQPETAAFASGKKHHIVINGLRYIGKEP